MRMLSSILIFQYLIAITTLGQNCLKLATPNDGEYVNMYYHMIDTCESSQTYDKLFVKNGILIRMNEYVFNQNPLPLDTFVKITAIDTLFDSVKTAFEEIRTRFGDFTFRRANLLTSDSEFVNNPIFILDFEEYLLFDTLSCYLYNVPNVILVMAANPPNKLYYVPTQYNEMKPNTDVANLLWNPPSGGGCWISTNQGTNWIQQNTGISTLDISVIKKIGTTIYMGTFSGTLYKSTNEGINWTEIDRSSITGNIRFTCIIQIGQDIYFGSYDQGLLQLSGSSIVKATVSPDNYITSITQKDNDEYYIGLLGKKAPQSLQKWTLPSTFEDFFEGPSGEITITSIVVINQDIIVGTKDDYVYKWLNNEQIWKQKVRGLINSHIACLAVTNNGYVLAGTNAGLYKSDLAVETWENINNTQLNNTTINTIFVSGTDIYIGTKNYGIFKSTDDGNTWTQINGSITCNNVKAIDVSGSSVYIGTNGDYHKIRSDFHKLGFNWNLYTMQCPMAWEITIGRKTLENKIVLANQLSGSPFWSDTQKDMLYNDWDYFHSDVKTNYIYPDNIEDRIGKSLKTRWLDIQNRLYPMPKEHGLWVLSMAITAMNNGPKNTLVGTAPNVNGVSIFGFEMWDRDLEKFPNGDLKKAFEAHPDFEKQAYRCDAYDFDVDAQIDNIITMPDVLNVSEGNDGERGNVIRHGIAHFACAGNWGNEPYLRYDHAKEISKENGGIRPYASTWDNDNTYSVYPDSTDYNINLPEINYTYLKQGKLDTKPICVGATIDGRQVDIDGITGDDKRCKCYNILNRSEQDDNNMKSLSWKQSIDFQETFHHGYAFSRDIYKFPTRLPSETDVQWTNRRLQDKANAYVDVVVPNYMIMYANDDNYGYRLFGEGTSAAAPQAAGIAALMLSVNKFMGEPSGEVTDTANVKRKMPLKFESRPYIPGEPGDPKNVQRRIYDIMTFTADKIIDDGNKCDACSSDFSNHTELTGSDPNQTNYSGHKTDDKYQYNYVEQSKNGKYYIKKNNPTYMEENIKSTGDPLRRWWAQRMGFGRVNAFRCIAHSIANKGNYEYTQSGILNFNVSGNGNENEIGEKLMHFGSKVKIGNGLFELHRDWLDASLFDIELPAEGTNVNVLNYTGNYFTNPGYGGVSITEDDLPNYNNQGVTKLNNSDDDVRLYVPANCILGIDGILYSENTNRQHDISTSSPSSGKILATGYIKNVSLSGHIKVSDLIISSTNDKFILHFNYNDSRTSEIYGRLSIRDKAKVAISTGQLNLQPGSEICLEGDHDFEIPANTVVRMYSGSKLSTNNTNRKVIIKKDGELIIDANSSIDIKCNVIIENEGKLTVLEDGVINTPKLITSQPESQINLQPGAKILPYQEIAYVEDENSYIYKTTGTGVLEINGNVLNLDNSSNPSKRIVVLNTISLKAGSTLEIDPNSTIDIGELNSEVGTYIFFHHGSNIRLFSDINDINGNLWIGYPSGQRTSLSGFSGKHPYLCYPNDINTFPQVICNNKSNQTQYFKIYETDCFNVFFKVINMYPKTVSYCNFTGNSLTLSQTNTDRFSFLNFQNTTYGMFMGTDLSVFCCNFIDQNPGKGYDNDVNGNPVPHLNGVYAQNCNYAEIDNYNASTYKFSNLSAGFLTSFCGTVRLYNSKIEDCYVGNSDFGSSNSLCFNQFNTTRIGSEYVLSKPWKTFKNNYFETQYGIQLDFFATLIISSNFFYNYFNGVNNNYSVAWLTGDGVPDNQYYRFKFGRNLFDMPSTGSFSNRFFTLIEGIYPDNQGDIGLARDLSYPPFLTFTSPIFINCGKNNMSMESRYHFAARGLYSYNIDGNNNDYNNDNQSHLIRYDNSLLNVTGINIDISEPPIQECAHNQTETGCNPIPVPACGYFVHNYGNWPEITDSAAIENLFWEALEDFCDGSLSCECLKIRLFDAMQAATFGVNNDLKLMLLIACLKEKELDQFAMDCIPTFILTELAEAQERLGLLDSAKITYNQILINFPNSIDTTFARWRIMYIDAQLSDSTFGVKYDSLMKLASIRYLKDIGKLDTCHSCGGLNKRSIIEDLPKKEIDEKIEQIAELKQNSPNPFSNETVIEFRLNQEANVRLGIHDKLGHTIKELINQRLSRGNYIYTFFNEGLASDMYLIILTFDGRQISKKMQLIK